jgi:hypothetical protein
MNITEITEALRELEDDRSASGRKLTFTQQCGVRAARVNNAKVSSAIIARAFEISKTAVSQIINSRIGGRYASIASELHWLGEANFVERYLTPEIIDRLRAARRELLTLKTPDAVIDDPEGFSVYGPPTWTGKGPKGWRFFIYPAGDRRVIVMRAIDGRRRTFEEDTPR